MTPEADNLQFRDVVRAAINKRSGVLDLISLPNGENSCADVASAMLSLENCRPLLIGKRLAFRCVECAHATFVL